MSENQFSRSKILTEGIKWREGLIPLKHSKHSQERLKQRIKGEFVVCPTMVRITKDNIHSGVVKGGKLSEVKLRLSYNWDTWLYIVIIVWTGTIKTLYLCSKIGKGDVKKKALQEQMETNKEEKEVRGADIAEQGGSRRNDKGFLRNMGRKTSFLRGIWDKIVKFFYNFVPAPYIS